MNRPILLSSVMLPLGLCVVCAPGCSSTDNGNRGDTATTSSDTAGSDTATSGDTGSGDTASAACRPKFASGLNVAWVNFASDIPMQAGELAKFQTLFANTKAAGGYAIRWWMHVNGTITPGYDGSGNANAISAQNITDIESILNAAHTAGVGVVISLWSFDMMQSGENITAALTTNNKNLLTVDANRQAYITNWLTPMVTALKGNPGLYAYEIFNEADGMQAAGSAAGGTVSAGWTPNLIPVASIIKTVNLFASAIHTADPTVLVTNSEHTFQANSAVNGYVNINSDAVLTAAGGAANGTLDFYEVHYYDNWGSNNSVVNPFAHPSSYWGLTDNKPIVIGEFWAIDTPGSGTSIVSAANLYTTLDTNGYGGAWAWQYLNADSGCSNDLMADGASYSGCPPNTIWPAMQVPMQNLLAADPTALACN